jgi:hypothetical protein
MKGFEATREGSIFIPSPPPPKKKREHPALQNMKFLNLVGFCEKFSPSWIRITYSDLDHQTQLNRIKSGSGFETLAFLPFLLGISMYLH